MIRPVLTEVGIFLIPFGLYALFLVLAALGWRDWSRADTARETSYVASGSRI